MSINVGIIGPFAGPLDHLIDTSRHYERSGYDAILWADHLMGLANSLWTPDITPLAHVMDNPNTFFDPVALMSAVGVHTETVRVGTCVTEAVRRHPAMLAQEWLSVDHLTKGRAILGIGPGEAENLLPYGIEHSRPVARMEEALKIVRLLWEHSDEVDYKGEFWNLQGAVCGLGPFEPARFPPIWLGANRPRGLGITGRLGDGWVPLWLPPDAYARGRETIRTSAVEAGRDPDSFTWSMVHYVTLAEDHERCHETLRGPLVKTLLLTREHEFFNDRGLEHPLGPDFRGIVDYVPTWHTREETLRAIDAVPDDLVHDFVMHGTPDEIVGSVRELEAVGLDHFVFMDITAYGDPTQITTSAALLDVAAAELRQEVPAHRVGVRGANA